jgi:hypothetical protein
MEQPQEEIRGETGCNVVAFVLMLLVLTALGVAAWLWTPSATPDPIDTGVPPVAPATPRR